MSAPIDIPESIRRRQQRAESKSDALNSAIAIAQMDPHSREDLICYFQALNECQASGDGQDEVAYLIDAIAEVFSLPSDEKVPDIDEWTADVQKSPEGRKAAVELKKETGSFFARYHELKDAAGLRTIKEVADAAGLSPTTVQAIESQRVKPQVRTVQALAKAFGVGVGALVG